MVLAVSKITRNFQITLPKYFRKIARLRQGEMIGFSLNKKGHLEIVPFELPDKDQSYYWKPENQREIALVMAEYKKGKGKKYNLQNIDELKKALKL